MDFELGFQWAEKKKMMNEFQDGMCIRTSKMDFGHELEITLNLFLWLLQFIKLFYFPLKLYIFLSKNMLEYFKMNKTKINCTLEL